MGAIAYLLLAVVAALLDLVAFAALILGILCFFTFENLQRWKWHFLIGGVAGLLVMLPLADYFINKALVSVTSVSANK